MMNEDELMKQALEDELEDSYQEYLTYALKGETQDLMQTSSEYRNKMEALCKEAENTETKAVPIRPVAKKKTIYLFAKAVSGLAAAAAVILLCVFGMNMIRGDGDKYASEEMDGNTRQVAQNVGEEGNGVGAAGDSNKTEITVSLIDEIKNVATSPAGQYNTYPEIAAATIEDSAVPASEGRRYQTEFQALRAGMKVNNGVYSYPNSEEEQFLTIPTKNSGDTVGPGLRGENDAPTSEGSVSIELFLPKHEATMPGVIRAAQIGKEKISYTEISREEETGGARIVLKLSADPAGEAEPGANLDILLVVSYGDEYILLAYRIL